MAGCAPSASGTRASADTKDTAAEAADWLGAAPEVDAADIVETVDTKLLIVGAGTAGMCAAGTASDLGLDFVLAEKNDGVQETREYLGVVNFACGRGPRRPGGHGEAFERAHPLRVGQVPPGRHQGVDRRERRDVPVDR